MGRIEWPHRIAASPSPADLRLAAEQSRNDSLGLKPEVYDPIQTHSSGGPT